MKQKVFSWKDKFFVKDEGETDRYYVEGEVFTLGKKLHVYDAEQREVAFIRQKVWSFLPRYYIEIGGETIEIVKEFTLLKPRFRFEGLPWTMQGDFWAHEYTMLDGERVVMQLSKKWLTWGDTYELDIADGGDELLCLCVALTVDCVLADQSASASASS
jgi:uncharacterized protein YxjI